MREQLDAGEIEFGLLVDGPEDGELALCWHGFPDSAWTWRELLPALAAEGYRAVAPYLPWIRALVAGTRRRLHAGRARTRRNCPPRASRERSPGRPRRP